MVFYQVLDIQSNLYFLTSDSTAAAAKEDKNVEIESLTLLQIWGFRMKWLPEYQIGVGKVAQGGEAD